MTKRPAQIETKRMQQGADTQQSGMFEGVAAVYGKVDQDGDIIVAGAFRESLLHEKPMLLWQHDPAAPIGDILKLDDRADGLHLRARLATSGKAQEAYDLLKLGAVGGLSVGFITREAVRDPATGVRHITRADLKEISVVSFPAQKTARVSDVKSQKQAPDNVHSSVSAAAMERSLRKAGLSRKQAKTVLSGGLSALTFASDQTPDAACPAQLAETIEMAAQRLRQTL